MMMDGRECSKSNSSNMVKKLCVTRPDEGVDRISELPDELIIVILSFLPLKKSAATSVLSPRWSELWKHTHNLAFGFQCEAEKLSSIREGRSENIESCKFIELVNSVIQSHKSLSLKKFRISFYVNNSDKSNVIKWLEYVFSRKVEELDLDCIYFDIEYRVVLELEELLRERRICQTDLLLFKSLKRLWLQGFKLSGEDIEVFLRNCPLLRLVTINSCTLMSDVEICGRYEYDIMLTHLDLQWCDGGKSIKVSGPHLRWINVDQKSGKLSIENVPRLERLGFRVGTREYVEQEFASAVSSCIFTQLKFLYLTLSHCKEFMADGFPRMPIVEELVVRDYGPYEQGGLLPLTAFIWACPRLQIFKLRLLGNLKDATSDGEVLANVERSPHQHLKIFEFQGVSQSISDRIVELMTYISDNCVALRKIVVGSPLPFRVEVQVDRDCLKQKLQTKLPHHIQLQFFEPIN